MPRGTMTRRQAEQWAQIRERGKNHFILYRGVLCWGGTTGVVWSLLMAAVLFSHGNFILFIVAMPFATLAFMVGGLFWGIWVWSLNEHQYELFTEG